ncbi:MAG: hypothetical protein IAE83_17795 [Anaerolinea sp.]|nr:hypothetical protein [Anaerolinea sp.]
MVVAFVTLALIMLVGINTVRVSNEHVQTADAQNTLIAQTEAAPLSTWETRLSGDTAFNRPDPFGNSPIVMNWNGADTDTQSLRLKLDQDVWLIANFGVRRFTVQVTENSAPRLSVGEDQTDGAFVWRLSPNGKWLGHNIRTDFGREIRLHNIAEQTTLTTNFRRNGVDFAWSPDMQWMILNLTEGATNTLRILPFSALLTNPDRALSDNARSIANGLIGAVDWSSKGILAYALSENDRLFIRFSRFDPANEGNEPLGEIDLTGSIPDRTLVRSLRWSPNGEHIAFTIAQSATDDQPRLYLIEFTKRWGLVLHELMPVRAYASPAWVSDQEVLSIGSDRQPWVLNIAQHQFYQVTNLSTSSEIVGYVKP